MALAVLFALTLVGQTSGFPPTAASPQAQADTIAGDDSGSTSSDPALPFARPVSPQIRPGSGAEGFQWGSASHQAAFFTGIMHAKRFMSEAGTRDALRGAFFPNWIESIKATRGWDDRDGFTVSYIGHPMEGSVFAFIAEQNDPHYRGLRFGDGRLYWIGKLRAMGFSAIWSTQWTLGPASEASLGNEPLYSSPGVVDLVGTPTIGTVWSIGEDMVDRYLLERLERCTANRALLLIARSFGNPTRSMANVMGLRRPWQRDNRSGLFGPEFLARSEKVHSRETDGGKEDFSRGMTTGLAERARTDPNPAWLELTASAHYETFLGGGSCIGGGGQAAFRVAPAWQIVTEASGCLIVDMPTSQSGDSIFYGAGPRWTPRPVRQLSPFLQLLMGGRKVTHETMDSELRAKLQSAWDAGELNHYPMRSEYSTEESENGFALLAGAGVDIQVSSALTVRVGNLEYTRAFLPTVVRINASQGVRFTAGLVLRIGTW